MESFPVLYVLMRNDLASMNSGKGMAQNMQQQNMPSVKNAITKYKK